MQCYGGELVLLIECDTSDSQYFVVLDEFPEDWNHVSDIQSLRALDRSFLFPGKILSFLVHKLWC